MCRVICEPFTDWKEYLLETRDGEIIRALEDNLSECSHKWEDGI